jgi:hypothetical protein
MRVIIIVYRSNPFQCFIFVRFQLASLLFPLCRRDQRRTGRMRHIGEEEGTILTG